MKADYEGCTEKCKMRNKLLEVDLDRQKGIVNTLIQFKWCPECSQLEPGAAKSLCQAGCGRALM